MGSDWFGIGMENPNGAILTDLGVGVPGPLPIGALAAALIEAAAPAPASAAPMTRAAGR